MNIIANESPMTPEDRQRWLLTTIGSLGVRMEQKYNAGQEEHRGDLGLVGIVQLLDEMEAEAVDQLFYIQELKRRLAKV